MKLEIGGQIPAFSLKDQNGNIVDIISFFGKKKLVIYFYPKNDTPGCTREACSFRDQFEDFIDMGAEVIGISADSVESHQKFIEKFQLPFRLLSDEKNHVRKLFGVPADLFGLIPGRVTYVADHTGKILHIFNSQLNSQKHIDEALKVLENI